jgi:hypothetical protein
MDFALQSWYDNLLPEDFNLITETECDEYYEELED